MLDLAKYDRFKAIVEGLRDRVLILITQVDPDAMGAAFALMKILTTLNPKCRCCITYCGAIGHPQNRAICNRFGLRGKMASIVEFDHGDLPEFDIVLVDSSSADESRIPEKFRPIKPKIVIDHHRGADIHEKDGNFVWIEEVGAVSTLISELAEEAKVELPIEERLMLALGIYTDTKALVGCCARDMMAYGIVTKHIPPESFASLIKYPLPPSFFDHLRKALETMETQGSRIVACAGIINPDEGDDVAAIADGLIRRTGATLVVVCAIIGDCVRLSARSSDSTMSLDEFLKARFGPKNAGAKLTPDGFGEGGATVTFNLGFWLSNGDDSDDLKVKIVLNKIRSVIFGH